MAYGIRFNTTRGYVDLTGLNLLHVKSTQVINSPARSGNIAFPSNYSALDSFSTEVDTFEYPILFMKDTANNRIRYHSPYGIPSKITITWYH